MTAPAPTRATLPGTRPQGAADESAASRQVREMFSGIAPRYDLLNHLLSFRFDVLWRNRVARRFQILLAQPDVRVLDLCCGTGDLALTLANFSIQDAHGQPQPGLVKGAQIIAADFAHPMLVHFAKKRATRKDVPPIEILEADALHLPFADESFDLITTAFGFRNLANYEAGLIELRRVLRPGGFLAILEFTEPRNAVFGRLFRFYFRNILPRIGGLISGNSKAYGYLPASVRKFPAPAELAQWMTIAGFAKVKFQTWTGGIVALHVAQRESSVIT